MRLLPHPPIWIKVTYITDKYVINTLTITGLTILISNLISNTITLST